MDDKNTQLILYELHQIHTKLDSHDENFKEISAKLASHDENFKEIKTQLTSLGNTVTKIEAEYGEKTQIALEYISGAIQQHDDMLEILDKINSKLDKHEVHIEVLEEKAL